MPVMVALKCASVFRSFQLPRIDNIEPANRARNMMIQPAFVLCWPDAIAAILPISSA
jgi:hypothetical protein